MKYRRIVANLHQEDFANPGPALLQAVENLLFLTVEDPATEYQEKMAAVLRSAYGYTFCAPRDTILCLRREQDLGKIKMDGNAGLDAVPMYRRMQRFLANVWEGGSRRLRSPWAAASGGRQCVRQPDMSFVVEFVGDNRVLMSTLAGIVETHSEDERAKAGLCQGILYCAFAHALTGADMGMYTFRTKFARMLALGPRLIAIEASIGGMAQSDAMALTRDALPRVLTAREFVQALQNNPQVVSALPWDLRGNDGYDPSALIALGKYATAGFDRLLDLERPDSELGFPRLRASPAVEVLRAAGLDILGDGDVGGLADDGRGLGETIDGSYDDDDDLDGHHTRALNADPDPIGAHTHDQGVNGDEDDEDDGWYVSDSDESLDEETTLALFADCGPRVVQVSTSVYDLLLRSTREHVAPEQLATAMSESGR